MDHSATLERMAREQPAVLSMKRLRKVIKNVVADIRTIHMNRIYIYNIFDICFPHVEARGATAQNLQLSTTCAAIYDGSRKDGHGYHPNLISGRISTPCIAIAINLSSLSKRQPPEQAESTY